MQLSELQNGALSESPLEDTAIASSVPLSGIQVSKNTILLIENLSPFIQNEIAFTENLTSIP